MQTPVAQRPLSAYDMEAILRVTRGLAAPFDLTTMLGEVVSAAKQVLDAERGSVWLYDAATDELVLEVATGIASGARADRQRAGGRLRALAADHQRARLLRRSALRSQSRQGIRLSDALHADAATCRPQGRAGRRHAGAEQAGRRVRCRRRDAGDRAGRAMRGRAAARAHDRCADRRREDAPGAGNGACSADEHAAGARCRRCRRTTSARRSSPPTDRRRHVRPGIARPGPAGRAGRRDRTRHRAGAVGDADAGDAADRVQDRRRPRDRVHPGQQPPGRDAGRRSLHHGVHRRARSRRRTGCASTAAARARSSATWRRPAAGIATSPRASRWARCRSRRCGRRSTSTCSRATSSCCCRTGSTSTSNPRGEMFGDDARPRHRARASRRSRWRTCWPGCCGRSSDFARRHAAGRRHDGGPGEARSRRSRGQRCAHLRFAAAHGRVHRRRRSPG